MSWDRIYQEKGIIQQIPKSFFAENIKKFSNRSARALDMGCGTGRHLPLLIEHFGEVHGCDVSSTAIELIGMDIMAKTRLKVSYFSSMPYPSGYFDFVISSAAIHHGKSSEVQKGFRELYRVLKRGGVAVIDVLALPHHPVSDGVEIEENTYLFQNIIDNDVPHYMFSEQKAREFLEGFDILAIERVTSASELSSNIQTTGQRLNIIARKK